MGFYVKLAFQVSFYFSLFSNNATNVWLPDPQVLPPLYTSLILGQFSLLSRYLPVGCRVPAALWSKAWFPADACGLCRGSEGTMKTRVHLGTFWRTAADVLSLWNEWVDKFTFLYYCRVKIRLDLTPILVGETKRCPSDLWPHDIIGRIPSR